MMWGKSKKSVLFSKSQLARRKAWIVACESREPRTPAERVRGVRKVSPQSHSPFLILAPDPSLEYRTRSHDYRKDSVAYSGLDTLYQSKICVSTWSVEI